MTDNNVGQKKDNLKLSAKKDDYHYLVADLESLKKRPVSRRGPFVISDEDLNNQFSLDKEVR